MAYSLTWLPDVLRAAGLKVSETSGWQSRGHGDMGKVQGVLCHHTSGAKSGNMPSLPVLINGRSDLAGPLSQLGLGRDGTYYIVCAGKGWHAGSGGAKGITDGNSHLIGIEAENTGSEPWPDVQMDAYRRGVAAILQHIGASSDYAIAHKEWTPRKPDPSFDMNQFRRDVATLMVGGTVKPLPDTPDNRPVLGKGDSGAWVLELQKQLIAAGFGVGSHGADGDFGNDTDGAVRVYQASRGLAVDGLVGKDTWGALMANKPPVSNPTTESGKGSWYSQYRGKHVWVDNGDAPGSAALGVPDDAQGVSFLNQSTLGKWFAVTAPNGVTSIEQQTDIGPATWTGRKIDISAAAAERFGYSPKTFPTDGVFSWRPVPAPSAVASLTPKQQAVKWRDLRGTPQLEPNPEPEPMPDTEAMAKILLALENIEARLTRLETAPAPGGSTSRSDWIEAIAGIGSGLERLPEIVDAADRLIARGPQIVSMIERIAQVAERLAPLIGIFTARQGVMPTYVMPQYQPPPVKTGPSTAVLTGSAAGGGMGFAVLVMEILSKLTGAG